MTDLCVLIKRELVARKTEESLEAWKFPLHYLKPKKARKDEGKIESPRDNGLLCLPMAKNIHKNH